MPNLTKKFLPCKFCIVRCIALFFVLQYDNVVMEEAAQILEVETFIPLMLQNTEDGVSRLKRVILIGDHHQVLPVYLTTIIMPFIFPVASSHKEHGFSEVF